MNGAPLSEDGRRLQITSTAVKTSMSIANAIRSDTGVYTLKVTSEAGEDNFDMLVKVIEPPGVPGRPIISD